MITYQVPENAQLCSMRAFLKTKGVSGGLFRRIKNSGCFRLNGIPVHANGTLLHPGDTVSYEYPESPQDIAPEDIPLDIRYEDDDLLIINKPAGMLVHPTPQTISGTLANALLCYYRIKGEKTLFHCVHRLDRMTSGLLLVAKRPEIQHLLSTKEGKLFHREYIAVAEGILEPLDGVIDLPIARNPESIITRIVSQDGKPAITNYKTEKLFELDSSKYSLLRLSLVTGRTHQIRVHLSHTGHPLLGDDLYGGSLELISRQALHAERILLDHPITGKTLDIRAELPADISNMLNSFTCTSLKKNDSSCQ